MNFLECFSGCHSLLRSFTLLVDGLLWRLSEPSVYSDWDLFCSESFVLIER